MPPSTSAPPPPRYRQLELAFSPQVSVDMRVDRLPDGRVLLTPSAEVRLWIGTDEAAAQLGKSRRWVQMHLETGLLRGEKVGRNWRVDAQHVQELRTRSRNF